MICSFFGHSKVPEGLGELLEEEIRDVIECFDSDMIFYVGDKGQFDRLVQLTFAKLSEEYPEIKVYVVLDYIPLNKDNYFNLPTVLPDGFERVPKRFAMSYRNKWMIDECDIALVYYNGVTGNTRKHIDMLKRRGKSFINIADMMAENLDNPPDLC